MDVRVRVAVVVDPGATVSEAGLEDICTTGFRSAVIVIGVPVTEV
jgi:hypothetical protein